MITYTKAEFEQKTDFLIDKMLKGAVFIHPTDTIYGLGCDATNSEAVSKLREIKSRFTRPFSIIAPSKNWIRENCEVNEKAEEWLNKLPGPYTLILNLKNKNAITKEVNNDLDTVGIRMIDHWFQNASLNSKKPIVTTSANHVGENFMTSLDNLNSEIKAKVDFAIYEGEKTGRPSTIIDLTKAPEEIEER